MLNEFVAYLKLAALPPGALDPRARLIMVYAMCGFANPGSVGIMIAGMGGLMPGPPRRTRAARHARASFRNDGERSDGRHHRLSADRLNGGRNEPVGYCIDEGRSEPLRSFRLRALPLMVGFLLEPRSSVSVSF